MKFSLLIEQDEEGRYVVECTDLPGCMTEGETLDEAIGNINEAIIGCIKSRLKTATEKIHIHLAPHPHEYRRRYYRYHVCLSSHGQAARNISPRLYVQGGL